MWFCFPQEEEKRIASVMARKEEEKKKEISKLAVLKASYLLTTGAQYIFMFVFMLVLSPFRKSVVLLSTMHSDSGRYLAPGKCKYRRLPTENLYS